MTAPSVIGWAIETLVATGLTMVAVMLLRGPVRRVFGSGIAYALWLLPAARLFLPHLPGDWRLGRLLAPLIDRANGAPGFVAGVLNPVTMPPGLADHATMASATLGRHHAVVALMPPTAVAGGPSAALLLTIAWMAGAVLFFGYHLVSHTLFCRRLVRGAAGQPSMTIGTVRVIESAAAASPLAFGIVRRYVAFPRDAAARYDAEERELALLHELGHHRNGDLAANWVALAMLSLHWFDPLAWRAFRAFRADQEMANDARVLLGRSAIERHAYACALVKAAHPGFGTVAATCHLNTVEDLKGRLKMLTTGRRSRARLALGAATIAALTVAGLGLTASGRLAARTVSEHGQSVAVDRTVTTAADGTPQTDRRHVTVVKDGKRADYDGDAADAYVAAHPEATPPTPPAPVTEAAAAMPVPPTPPAMPDVAAITADAMRTVPQVVSATCPGSANAKPPVMETTHGATHRITICTNRIARLTSDAVAEASKAQGMTHAAYKEALDGLIDARADVAAETDMTADARAQALAAIDTSIAEMRRQLARQN